jgi:hypothetical protein
VRLVLGNVDAHFTMFHGDGGRYARDNVPGWPLVDPATGAALLAGMALLAAGDATGRPLLGSWFAVVVLGGVMSRSGEGAPYPYRVGNLAPWACIVAGLTLARLGVVFGRRARRIAAALLLAMATAWNGWALFVATPASNDVASAFGTLETRLGLWLSRHPDWRPCLLAPETLPSWRAQLGTLRHPSINGRGFFTGEQSLAAIHASAGAWRKQPSLALDPVASNGVAELGMSGARALDAFSMALPPGAEPPARWAVADRHAIEDDAGHVLCIVWRVSRRP